MTLSLSHLQQDAGNIGYSSVSFRNTIEDHVTWLKESSLVNILNIEKQHQIKYRGDFFGLLNQYGVKPDLHWITMRINGLHTSGEYDGSITTLFIPNRRDVDYLLGRHVNTSKYV